MRSPNSPHKIPPPRSCSGEIPPTPAPSIDWSRVGAVLSTATSALGLALTVGLTTLKFASDCRCAATILNTCGDLLARFLPELHGSFDCTAAFASPYAVLLGVPLTIHAAALYTITLVLGLAAARGGPAAPRCVAWLFIAAALNVAASCVMFAISTWILHAWCLFCFCLYFLSTSLLASAGLALHGLRTRPWTRAHLRPSLPASLALFGLGCIAVQAVPYATRCDRNEPGCFHDLPAPPPTTLRLGAAAPDVVLAVFIDPSCSACAHEFVALQQLVRNDRGLAVQLYHYPRESTGCGLPGARLPVHMLSAVNAGACNLSFAVECIAEQSGPELGVEALARTFDTRTVEPASAHLDAILTALVEPARRPAIERCIHARKGAVPERIAEQLRYGARHDIRTTPTILVAPVRDGVTAWNDAQLLPGSSEARLLRTIQRARQLPTAAP